jgi:hypothetical protein
MHIGGACFQQRVARDPRALAAAQGRSIPAYVTGWLVRAVRAEPG